MASVKERTPDQFVAPAEERLEKSEHTSGEFEISIYDAWCKDCALCVEFCPRGVLSLSDLGELQVVAPEKCKGCMQCVLHCPDFAINVTPKKNECEVREARR